MTEDARSYLLHRFTNDATQLRERVVQLRKGVTVPGPDATTSERMADACDDVANMLTSLPLNASPDHMVQSLLALVPQLEKRAQGASVPPVRAVYIGAATRVKEVATAEAKASSAVDAEDADIADDGDEFDEDDEA